MNRHHTMWTVAPSPSTLEVVTAPMEDPVVSSSSADSKKRSLQQDTREDDVDEERYPVRLRTSSEYYSQRAHRRMAPMGQLYSDLKSRVSVSNWSILAFLTQDYIACYNHLDSLRYVVGFLDNDAAAPSWSCADGSRR